MDVTPSDLSDGQLTIPGHLTPARRGGMWDVWSEMLFSQNLNFPWEYVHSDKVTLVLLLTVIPFFFISRHLCWFLSGLYSHLASLSQRRAAKGTKLTPLLLPTAKLHFQGRKSNSKFKTQFKIQNPVQKQRNPRQYRQGFKIGAILGAIDSSFSRHHSWVLKGLVCIYFWPTPGWIYALEKRRKI